MSDDEIRAVLEDAHTAIFTSLRQDGRPISLPVWFVAFDGRIYIGGPAHTKKFARVRNDPRVSVLFESGRRWAELVGVHVSGHARVVEDDELRRKVRDLMDAKYASYKTAPRDMPDATRAHYEVEVGVIEVVPDDRILSWDNSKLDLG